MGRNYGLGSCSRLTLHLLLVLWVLAIISECADLTKRDVVHRIVLKSGRKPRSQKHHQNYGRGHGKRENRGHKHGHRDHDKSTEFDDSRYDSYEENRERGRNRSPEDSRESRDKSSRESKRDSRENSYEGSYENVRYQNKERPTRQKHHRFNRLHDDFEVEESRIPEPSKIRSNGNSAVDNWATTADDVPSPPPKTNLKKKPKKFKTAVIEFTTSFPVQPPQFSAYEPLYPPLPALPAGPHFPSTFQYNQQTEVSEVLPQFPVLQPSPVNGFTNFLPVQTTNRNFSNTYEVHEREPVVQPTKSFPTSTISFQKVKPTAFQKTSSTHSVNFGHSTPANLGIIIKDDVKKLPTTRPVKKRVKTKV